jgi:hypothetical protein
MAGAARINFAALCGEMGHEGFALSAPYLRDFQLRTGEAMLRGGDSVGIRIKR